MGSLVEDGHVGEKPPAASLSDARLLRSFLHQKDEAAFELLVRRHAPMVLGVCRRLLGNEHDAADAFQAVFLVLARKAASIRCPDVLGGWLYNVACRTSMKARTLNLKRKARERQVGVMPEPVVEPEMVNDVLAVLDEELHALPQKYQTPTILCELQGESRKDAAAKLQVPEGTLSSRLATARKLLAERMRKRGVVISAAALGVVLAENTVSAAVPAMLILSSVKAALPAAAGQGAAGVVSAKAIALSDGVIKSMFLAKLKVALCIILVPCLVAGAIHLGMMTSAVEEPDDEAAAALATFTKLGAKLKWQALPEAFPFRLLEGKKADEKKADEKKPEKKLVGIDFRRTKVRDEHLTLLRFFQDLREVVVAETAITDAGCKHFAALPKLQVLRLGQTAVSDEGLKHLAALTELRVLGAGWTKIKGPGLADLAALTELHELDLRQTGIKDADLKALAPFQKLHTLELGKNKLTDAGLTHLAGLSSLRRLRMEATGVTDAGMEIMHPQLESLSVVDTAITDDGVRKLAPLHNLAVLNLSGTKVSDAVIKPLILFKHLYWLGLERTALTGAGFDDPNPLKLTTLWMNGSKLNDAGAKHTGKLNTLHYLYAEKTGLSDAGVKEFAALAELRSLNLEGTDASDAALPSLAGLKWLWQLNLNSTKVTDTGMKVLVKYPSLRSLTLHATVVGDTGIKDLTALKDLDNLWLSWTMVTEAGLKDVARFSRLSTLRLGGLKVTDKGLKTIGAMKSLRTLWLDWTKVSDDGMEELAGLTRLEELRLDGTGVTKDGLKALAGLKSLQRVEVGGGAGPDVIVAAKRKDAAPTDAVAPDAAPEQDTKTVTGGISMFWWLYAAGAIVTLGALAWLGLKRKPVLVPALVSVSLAGLVLLIRVLWPTPDPETPPIADQSTEPVLRKLEGHTGPVRCVRLTPDGKKLISASGWPGRDYSIRIWDTASGKELHRLPAPGQVGAVELTHDGKHAVAASLGAFFYIDVESGEALKVFRQLRAASGGLFLSRDGRHAYTASQDGLARRWDLVADKVVGEYRVAGKWARGVAELPNGQLLTMDSNGVLQFWDVKDGKEIKRIETGPGWFTSMTLAPDGKHALLGTWDVKVWDLERGRKVRTMKGHKNDVSEITFTPDGKKVLTASMDGTVRLWDYESGDEERVVSKQEEFMLTAEFSKDGRLLASGGGGRKEGKDFVAGADHAIRVWELPKALETPAVSTSPPGNGRFFWVVLLSATVVAPFVIVFLMRRGRLASPATREANEGEDEDTESPAAIRFACSHCGKQLRARAALAGKNIRCPQCGIRSQVPADATDATA